MRAIPTRVSEPDYGERTCAAPSLGRREESRARFGFQLRVIGGPDLELDILGTERLVRRAADANSRGKYLATAHVELRWPRFQCQLAGAFGSDDESMRMLGLVQNLHAVHVL